MKREIKKIRYYKKEDIKKSSRKRKEWADGIKSRIIQEILNKEAN
jgi:hypothetical protein